MAFFFTLIPNQAAIAQCINLSGDIKDDWFPSENRVPLNLWTKLWHSWGCTKGGFEGVGELFCKLKFLRVPDNKKLFSGRVILLTKNNRLISLNPSVK